jgi:transcription antitermination factor NusG
VHTYAGQEEKIKQNLERRIEALGLKERIAHVWCRLKTRPRCAAPRK